MAAVSMRDEYEPDYPANDKDHRSGDEYLLQYFHIFLHIKIMRLAKAMHAMQVSGAWPSLPWDHHYQGISWLS
jgi:hypothetical protein